MSEKKLNESNINTFYLTVTFVILAALTRFIPHPFNFTAIGAMALFSGANFNDKRYAFIIPITVMFLTDIVKGFHFSIVPVYACIAFTIWMGTKIRERQNAISIIASSLISSVVFFLITNLPLWYLDLRLYPMTVQGTVDSYIAAIPFFTNQVLGDVFYNFVLFGVFHLVKSYKMSPVAEKEL